MSFINNISVFYSESFVASANYLKKLMSGLKESHIILVDKDIYRISDYNMLQNISMGLSREIYEITDDLSPSKIYIFWNVASILTTDIKRALVSKKATIFIFSNNNSWFKLKEFNKIDIEYDSRNTTTLFKINGRELDEITMTNFILREFKFDKILNKK